MRLSHPHTYLSPPPFSLTAGIYANGYHVSTNRCHLLFYEPQPISANSSFLSSPEPCKPASMDYSFWYVEDLTHGLYLTLYCRTARIWILSILQSAVSVGRIEIEENGKLFAFGQCEEKFRGVRITVVDEHFWTRVLL